MVCYAAGFTALALGVPVPGWRKKAILQQEFHPASREIHTEVCFLHVQLMGTKRVTAKDTRDSPEADFAS